jgi:hypothetical protein
MHWPEHYKRCEQHYPSRPEVYKCSRASPSIAHREWGLTELHHCRIVPRGTVLFGRELENTCVCVCVCVRARTSDSQMAVIDAVDIRPKNARRNRESIRAACRNHWIALRTPEDVQHSDSRQSFLRDEVQRDDGRAR